MALRPKYLFFFLSLITSNVLFAQEQQYQKSIFDFFQADTVIHWIIETDFEKLLNSKEVEEWQEASLTFKGKGGILNKWGVKVRTRGNMRKKICDYPPVKIKFPEDTIANRSLKPFNSIKLVTNCRTQRSDEKLLLREYLAYKLYNVLTEVSFRVQLIQLTYLDTGKKHSPFSRKALIIEPVDELAERLDGTESKLKYCHERATHDSLSTLMTVFQYFISNPDWQIVSTHNVKVIKSKKYQSLVVVPYDFDYSGIVNADYATPHSSFPITHVRQRFYMGACRTMEELESIFEIFHQKRPELMSEVELVEGLTERDKRTLIRFFDEFYETIAIPKRVKREFIEHCKDNETWRNTPMEKE